MDLRSAINLIESKSTRTLELATLNFSKSDLSPVLSEKNLDNHYSTLAKGYVDRFNRSEGDSTFNEAGAYLHNIYFPGLQAPESGNKPTGVSKSIIEKKYGSFNEFKEKFALEAMKIQGSGWIYMDVKGDIKIIKNHEIKKGIALLIDWWEHAYIIDYQSDKKKYLKNAWKIVDWSVVNDRMSTNP